MRRLKVWARTHKETSELELFFILPWDDERYAYTCSSQSEGHNGCSRGYIKECTKPHKGTRDVLDLLTLAGYDHNRFDIYTSLTNLK